MLIRGFFHGIGFSISTGLLLFLALTLLGKNILPADFVEKAKLYVGLGINSGQLIELENYQTTPKKENPLLKYISSDKQINIPPDYKQFNVTTADEFYTALEMANDKGNTAIIFNDGIYQLKKRALIKQPNIMLLSKSGKPKSTVLIGKGMKATSRVENLIEVHASGFVLDGLTLKEAPNHLIQIKSELNTHFPIIRNCILQDGYEQLIKVSYDKRERADNYSDNGLVENCEFSYTEGIGPNYYIGGIDAHGIKNWTIRNNLFKDIASPGKRISEHAVHLWNNTENNLVIDNIFIDSDRAIGFGMYKKPKGNEHKNIVFSNYGGLIKGNIIFHANNKDPFADTGIILENSPRTVVEDNQIYIDHDYRRAIEYRFPQTSEVLIQNNATNKTISSRNGGDATVKNNDENLDKVDFIFMLNKRLVSFNNMKHFQ